MSEVFESDEVTASEDAVTQDITELSEAELQRDEYLDALQRLQADFENYRKRMARSSEDAAVRAAVSPLPAWAIGGLEPADLPQLRHAGLSGVAVSSGLFRSLRIDAQFKAYSDAWQGTTSPLLS